MAADQPQGVPQGRSVILDGGGRAGIQDAEQAVAGGLLAPAAVLGLGALQVGQVDEHQAPVDLLGGQRQPMELGQGGEQEAVGFERRGRSGGKP